MSRAHPTAVRIVSFALAAVSLAACEADRPPPDGGVGAAATTASADAPAAEPSHRRMVDTLARLAREADPRRVYALNGARADELARAVNAAPDATQRTRLLYRLASEQLAAGRLDDAQRTLETVTSQLELTAQSKPFYDLLAAVHLRRGEVANCRANHNAETCILPIRAGGQHADPSGSRAAIALLERILAAFPDDAQSRWLLNLAHQTLGTYPAGVPAALRVPGLGEAGAPSRPRPFVDVGMAAGAGVDALSGGVAVGDFTGDGLPDLFATSYGLTDDAALLVAQPEGGYARLPDGGDNLAGITGGLNVRAADYDDDGDLDVLVLRGGWFGEGGNLPNSLLRNDGRGRFTDVTYAVGLGEALPTQTAAWADFDLDGDLDLYVGTEASNAQPTPARLYLNEGAAGFRESARESGAAVVAMTKGVTAGDVNGDGLPDLYLSNLGQPNRLLINATPPGGPVRFRDGGDATAAPLYSFPTWLFDFDQDGDLDLFASGYDARRLGDVAGEEARVRSGRPTESDRLYLYVNDGAGGFRDAAEALGLGRPAFTMGSNFGDPDGDGYPDVYLGTGAPDMRSVVPNLYFANEGGRGFRESGLREGVAHVQKGHGVGFADLDGDGDEDLYTVLGGAFEGDHFPNALFERRGAPANAWVALRLEGVRANRSAIGARLTAFAKTADGTPLVRHQTVGAGGSFGGNDLEVLFGLGAAERVDSVVVHWPVRGGDRQVARDLALGRRYAWRQGESPRALDVAPRPLVAPGSEGAHAGGHAH